MNCTNCNYKSEAIPAEMTPVSPGSICICLHCDKVVIFEKDFFRKMTGEEIERLKISNPRGWAKIQMVREYILRRKIEMN